MERNQPSDTLLLPQTSSLLSSSVPSGSLTNPASLLMATTEPFSAQVILGQRDTKYFTKTFSFNYKIWHQADIYLTMFYFYSKFYRLLDR